MKFIIFVCLYLTFSDQYRVMEDSWNSSTTILTATFNQDNTTSFLQYIGLDHTHKARAATWLTFISYICVPFLLLIGLCGNSLTVIVTRGRMYRHSSHGVYLTAMAISDIIFLLAFPFSKHFIHDLFGTDIRALSTAGCKLYFFFFRASRSISASLIVLICIERFVAVWFPLRTRAISTKKAAFIAVSFIFVGVSTFSAIWTLTANIKNDKCVPVVLTTNNQQVAEVCSAIGMSLRTCIPAVMLLCLTPLTVGKLYHQRSLRREMGYNNSTDETYRVTLMLISVIIAFYVLITPFCIAKHALLFAGIDIVTSKYRWARNLYEISQICEQTNCVINFILYVMLSSSFRHHVCVLFKCDREKDKEKVTSVMSIDTLTNRYS